MGENPSPSGEDFSRLAELWRNIARPRMPYMTSSTILCGSQYGDMLSLRELIREICKSMDVEIIRGHVSKDHVHLFVSVPPYHPASTVMKRVKGKTSRKLLSESRLLAKQFWGRHLWARGYFAATSGNVTDEVIAQYIETQGQIERDRDDDFTVE